MLPEFRPDRSARSRGHVPPEWVDGEATFFLTINCQRRGVPQLTIDELPGKLFACVSHYRELRRWWPEIVILMPDHLHMLVTFSWEPGNGMNAVIRDWKRYTARTFGIEWQRDYFDHRVRSEADHADKWQYIRENPVRSRLVECYDQWAHVWFPDRVGWDRKNP
ncbi:hypothetical protein OJ996_02130 [Luteolibacter sp. GHJ8]|uniref:Transposase IS200-like domain-containing protein n=1 Tax=Luteolibacter rhizosphaerae TaxID=2989719 RepID=A0ABT3FXP2_9BACT|nr:hypothetical protein [Luteolibacter rhizosphaerae]MCW1912353.1 hypothetical protein [Luteolibacter rhizosphaerae]